jgi:hypothetical protein
MLVCDISWEHKAFLSWHSAVLGVQNTVFILKAAEKRLALKFMQKPAPVVGMKFK